MEEVKHLPSEVISDILSRLPIESIMQAKSVCKSWLSLIEDPSFVELQLKRSKNRPHRLILWEFHSADKVRLLDRDKGQKDIWKARDLVLEYTWKYGEEEKKLVFDIVGSCNGLLCMVSCFKYGCCSLLYGIFICNPITKECVMLPVGNGLYYHEGQIGFGVDSTGKYKVIQIFRKPHPSMDIVDDYMLKGEIITLGESSWREIGIPYQTDYTRCDAKVFCRAVEGMVFMNGLLYCIIQKPTTHNQPIILVFDLHDEKFRTIDFPASIELPNYYELGLTEIKGSLALHHRLGESPVIRMWLIEINKSKGNELYHCDHISVAMTWPNIYKYFDLVGMLSNNLLLYRVNDRDSFLSKLEADPQLIEERGSHLLVYCFEKKQFMRVGVSEAIPRWFEAKSFVPSLVSPIAIACGKTEKYTRSRFQGLHLEVLGYSSLWELMVSCRFHPTFRSQSFSDCSHRSPPSE